MIHKTKSIRPFIGAKNFEISRNFYRDLGFEEVTLGNGLSVFKAGDTAFYLQDVYVKDWIENTMIFMEVDDVSRYHTEISELNLGSRYESVKLMPVRDEDWGKECFLQDPSGVLLHFGEFY